MKIPQNNNWTQLNSGIGVLKDTENIELDQDGKLRLSNKTFNRINSDDEASLGNVLSIVYYGTQYLALTSTGLIKYALGDSTTTAVAVTGDTGLGSDMQVAYQRAYITTDDNLDYYDGSLNAGNYALTTSVPHPMALFDSLPTYKLCIGNGNAVVPLNSSHSAGTILTLPEQYQVTTLAYRNGYLYVGTRNTAGGEAKVFIWDGVGTNANYEVPVGTTYVYSIIPYKDTVAFSTNDGRVLSISGTSAVLLSAFPVFYDASAIWDITEVPLQSKIIHRGMVAVGDKIWLNIDGTVDTGFMAEMKNGLWVYDPNRGLYHRTNHSVTRSVVEAASSLSSDTLTLSVHNLKDGDLVTIRSAGSLTGVKVDRRYFAKVISTTTIKLALSHKALLAGNYVSIGGAVTSSSIGYVPNLDYTQYQDAFAGAISAANPAEPFYRGWESPVMWGSRIDDLSGAAFYSLNGFNEGWNIGRFTLERLYSPNIKQDWQKVFGFINGCYLDNEKIIVKYKTDTSNNYPTDVFKGVWLSVNTINSIATKDEDQWTDIEEGDELTILDGYGRGYTTHVVSKTNSSGTYTVEVDESIGTINGDVYFSADSFKKITEIDNTREEASYFEALLNGVHSTVVSLKFELRGFNIEVNQLDVINNKNT